MSLNVSRIKNFSLAGLSLVFCSLLLTSCNLVGSSAKINDGVVIAPKAILRSSTAMVALPVAELKRGDRLDIYEQAEVKTPTRIEEWYKVKTVKGDSGWIEARYVVNKSVIDRIEALFQQTKDLPSQGQGRLKVQAKLRINAGGDVVTYLNRGTIVEIVGKARTTVKPEAATDNADADDADDDTGVKTQLWLQVRMPDSEVLRAGWIGAQQVELDVPDEILHLEGDGRRFTGWVVYDQSRTKKGEIKNNYIGLMKSVTTEGPIDFTRLWFLNYSPEVGRYVNGGLDDGLRGVLPVTLGTPSGRKGFTIQELDENGKTVAVAYEVTRSSPDKVTVKRLSPKIQVKKPPKKIKSK
ncbi:MAG: hypothetical protein HY231_21385 [Acidobacteria bacterium]|nr:hypothetical protein [Acidobacteriota bacterium]